MSNKRLQDEGMPPWLEVFLALFIAWLCFSLCSCKTKQHTVEDETITHSTNSTEGYNTAAGHVDSLVSTASFGADSIIITEWRTDTLWRNDTVLIPITVGKTTAIYKPSAQKQEVRVVRDTVHDVSFKTVHDTIYRNLHIQTDKQTVAAAQPITVWHILALLCFFCVVAYGYYKLMK